MANINLDLSNDLFVTVAQPFALENVDGMDLEAFKTTLTQRIAYLLDHDLNMLMHLLYRIDVHEADAKRILMLSPPSEIASDLTDLILDRLHQKLKYRRHYQQYQAAEKTWWNEE